MISTEGFEAADAAIDGCDHLPLAVETFTGSDVVPGTEYPAREFLEPEHALGFRQGDPAAAMPEGFGEQFVIARHRDALEDVLLRVEQGRGGAFCPVARSVASGRQSVFPEPVE